MLLSMAALAGCMHGIDPEATPDPRDRSRATSATDFDDQAVSRVEELFVGRFPGVQVYTAPGGITVRIRGTTTVNGDAEPLYVVDGFALQPGNGGLLPVNPRDVARIEVLKDAGSLAEYGVRGANGVIRITTKRGR
jgi:TonB-dependent SusC/RagA subfamily outer membrane receptor